MGGMKLDEIVVINILISSRNSSFETPSEVSNREAVWSQSVRDLDSTEGFSPRCSREEILILIES